MTKAKFFIKEWGAALGLLLTIFLLLGSTFAAARVFVTKEEHKVSCDEAKAERDKIREEFREDLKNIYQNSMDYVNLRMDLQDTHFQDYVVQAANRAADRAYEMAIERERRRGRND